ncbi:hypothetical protein PPL_10639 [Heterostelium album PN500]|uniref:EGF-like domain-containing protein n=1 Tax=Heterostelium pallidum (strain ATCC 26659 / Pp 5 / PN500) TaxID=670386 RepID=D3BRM8_HETP5|nr:hypothetical protein PPL_10639 [Heterostelium album PN500]EFA76060.1 hypothetical protein PPL_10639 [Heterostelium album PN500]|eukprot:XP_020428194.1 hypothetical protein PPL_10639 [Heterostelium album PN500]
MNKKYLLLLLFTVVLNNISSNSNIVVFAEYDIDKTEANSLNWLIQQYGMSLYMKGYTCSSYNIDQYQSNYIECVDDPSKNVSHITTIYYSDMPFNDTGSPPFIDALSFGYLKTLVLSPNQDVKDISYNILRLLDQPENINITNLQLINQKIDVYEPFPRYLYQNLQLKIMGTTSSGFPQPIMINDGGFPKLTQLTITINHSLTLNHSTITNLSLVTSDLCLISANSLRIAEISQCNFSNPLDFSGTENLVLEIKDSINLNLTNMNYTQRLLIENTPFESFPPESWFAPGFELILSETGVTGVLPHYIKNIPYTFYVTDSNTSLVTAQLYDTYCLTDLNIRVATLTSNYVPDCFYCYWDRMETFLPTNTQPPPDNFKCNVSLDSQVFYTDSIYNFYISGKNLGYGDGGMSSDLSLIYSNTLFRYFVSSLSGKQKIVFSRKYNVSSDVIWGQQPRTDISLAFYNFETKDTRICTRGHFNEYSPFILSGDNRPCERITVSSNWLNCTIYGYNPQNTVSMNVSDTVQSLGFYSYRDLVIKSVSNITYEGGDITIKANFGKYNFKTQAWVNNTQCEEILVTDDMLICNIKLSLENQPTVLDLMVYSNSYTVYTKLNVVEFLNDCGEDSLCNGNGQCLFGRCQCTNEYYGNYCDYKIETNINFVPNDTSPSPAILNNGVSFSFNIHSIQEIDPLGNLIQEIPTDKWDSKVSENTITSVTTYTYTITNSTTNIIASIEYSTVGRTVVFANQSNYYSPYNLKLSIEIDDWQYSSLLNNLVINVLTKYDNSEATEKCSGAISSGKDPNNLNSINYIGVNLGGTTFYGRFLPLGIFDGRVIQISNELKPSESPEFTTVAIKIPHCKSCKIDPDFTMLLNPSGECNNPEHKSKSWMIAAVVAVTGSIFIAFVVGTIIYIIKKKKKNRDHKRRTGKLKQYYDNQL